MRETRESARMISCLRITLKGILPLATLAELSLMRALPHTPAGSKAPAPSKRGFRPRAARFHPTLAAGQRGREIPCPYRDSLWSWRRYKGQGASPCALLILGGAAPCGTARTPFRCIFHPKTPLFFVKGTLIDGLSPSV